MQRYEKFLYRIVKDYKDEYSMKRYTFEDGFAGYVAKTACSLFQPSISSDRRFLQELDDANFGESKLFNPAREVIGVPIFASDDHKKVRVSDRDSMARIPRAVVLCYNRVPDPETQNLIKLFKGVPEEASRVIDQASYFELEDVDRLGQVCSIFGRCHHVINQIEQMNVMKSITYGLTRVSDSFMNHIDTSKQSLQMM